MNILILNYKKRCKKHDKKKVKGENYDCRNMLEWKKMCL